MKLLASLPAGPARGRVRLDGIDELKGVGLILVIAYHIGGVLDLANRWHGEVGVDVFLLVSGFLCALSPVETPWREFLRRRFVRIYPGYWMALALFIGLAGILLGRAFPWSDLVLDVLGVHAVVGGAYFSDVNESFWFVTTIVALYLTYLAIRRWSRDVLVVLGVGGLSTLVACLPYPGFEHLAGRLPGFFIGAAIGQLVRSGEIGAGSGWVLALGGVAAGWLAVTQAVHFAYPVEAIGLAALVLGGRAVLARNWAGRAVLAPLRWLGVCSYEIYLLHQPLIRDYVPWFYRHLLGRQPTTSDLEWGIAVALACTLALARAVAAAVRRPGPRVAAVAAAGAVLMAVGAGAGPSLARLIDVAAVPERLHRAPGRAEYAGWSGPLRLELELPASVGGPAGPLVVTGIAGQADLLGVIRVDATHVRLTFDHWGAYSLTSPTLLVGAGPNHAIEIFFGSLLPPIPTGYYGNHAALLPWTRRLLVRIDGQVAFDRAAEAFPSASNEIVVGYNGLGGSTTGEILSAPIHSIAGWTPPGWPVTPP
jgi:peptidoglycan/LPS O-acetylase OafA/YrhL